MSSNRGVRGLVRPGAAVLFGYGARDMKTGGKVYLVGAGPGDPELITAKAARVLAHADVILCDDLVNPALLEYVRTEARVVHVGKRGGRKSTPQAFIDALMIKEAKNGLVVVRLKGGDPFVFGRGGEERATLTAAGIEVEVVNGVTAGVAAPASVGIPLTHRTCCHGVAFITGCTHGNNAPDWRLLARAGLTLVIYMGVARCHEIQARLVASGMAATTPAAVIENATLPNQRSLITTLGNLPDDIAAHGFGSPAIIVIGDVARVADAAVLPRLTQAAPATGS
ncbi:MAG TPA: uroporphyrinogen-III C-methyltransferase [Burkholderiales bacterium]|nr:uroporphyrinogen-III C-methyltransferase [Burkholderiales bacterium]